MKMRFDKMTISNPTKILILLLIGVFYLPLPSVATESSGEAAAQSQGADAAQESEAGAASKSGADGEQDAEESEEEPDC